MPFSGSFTATRDVGACGIKKGDVLRVVDVFPYAASDGDTYYRLGVERNGKRLEGFSCPSHKQLTGKKDERPPGTTTQQGTEWPKLTGNNSQP